MVCCILFFFFSFFMFIRWRIESIVSIIDFQPIVDLANCVRVCVCVLFFFLSIVVRTFTSLHFHTRSKLENPFFSLSLCFVVTFVKKGNPSNRFRYIFLFFYFFCSSLLSIVLWPLYIYGAPYTEKRRMKWIASQIQYNFIYHTGSVFFHAEVTHTLFIQNQYHTEN